MGRLYDVLSDLARARRRRSAASALPGGHNLQEDVPDMVLEEILP